MLNNRFWKIMPLPDNIEKKHCTAGHRPQMTIWHMCIEYWIPNTTKTHSEYVILIAFPLQ